jgi:hypothetical protein
MKKVLWITWESQRRNKEIADAIPASYIKMSDTLKKHRLVRYRYLPESVYSPGPAHSDVQQDFSF